MDVPTLVSDILGDEEVAADVALDGDDALYVTPTRTIHYSAEGILSDESIEEIPHDAERVSLSKGRRSATITLDYGTDGTKELSVPARRADAALHPVIAGVLSANDVTGPGETVQRTFRFSELTLVVTSDRLIKHVGSAVWDQEFEEIPYDSVSELAVEEGNVSSQYVVSTPDRMQRIKAPNESFRAVRETIEDAVLSYHDADSVAEFNARDAEGAVEEDDASESEERAADADDVDTDGSVEFDRDMESLGGSDGEGSATEEESTGDAGESSGGELAGTGFTSAAAKVEPDVDVDALRDELSALEAAIESQREEIERQQATIDAIRELIPDR